MKLQLTENFTVQEKSYIDWHLVMIRRDNYVSIDSDSIIKFLKRLSYSNSEDDRKVTLSSEEKKILAHKLIDWIMQTEEAFIKIMMDSSSMLTCISILPLFNEGISALVEKAASLVKSNQEAREMLIRSLFDINILSEIGSYSEKLFLRALYDANDFDRLIKNNEDLCIEVKRFPKYTRVIITYALNNEAFFNTIFTSEEEFSRFEAVLAKKDIKIPEKMKNLLMTALDKSIEAQREQEEPLSLSNSSHTLWQNQALNQSAGEGLSEEEKNQASP